MTFLSVIIPAYNEEERMGTTLLDVDRYLTSQQFKRLVDKYSKDPVAEYYEIIVVDDGSLDKTSRVIRDLGKSIKNLKLVGWKRNAGKGASIKFGMLTASGRYRIFMDADNSTTINQVESLIQHFDHGYDVVIGSRVMDGSKILVHQPLHRRFLGKLGNLIIQALVLPGIVDTQAGFKAFSAQASEEIFSRLTINGWSFDVEALTIARNLGYNIKETSIIWGNDPCSRLKPYAYLEALLATIMIFVNVKIRRYGFKPKQHERKCLVRSNLF